MMVAKKYVLTPVLAAVLAVGSSNLLAAPPAHLGPFPEDAAEKAAPAKPVKPEPPKSNFQPRFRPPSVKPAENLEQPAEAKPKTDSEVVPASATEPVADEPQGESAASSRPKTVRNQRNCWKPRPRTRDRTAVVAWCRRRRSGKMRGREAPE